MTQHITTFEAVREITGWVRPGHEHGCRPVEVVPCVWTANYHDIDSAAKLKKATGDAPIKLVVNSALCQCEARDGFYGPDIKVMEIVLEDDPDERKAFDAGKHSTSKCTVKNLALDKRCAGDAMKDFDACCEAVDAVVKSGGHVLIHCKASISRSAAFVLAYMMKKKKMSLLGAVKYMKGKWDATWPCDRFVLQLIEYETYLAKPYRYSKRDVAALCATSAAAGAAMALAALVALRKLK